MPTPSDYAERVYAGVLGKIIGVYLGRPFEGWSYKAITERFGQIDYYVHERLGVPLVVTDDDISGTFTFLRALPDSGAGGAVSAAQIGQAWLNYIIENRTILWWGGMGNSTEHTAFLRLKHGISAPQSGSASMNGQVVAEQIGAQIFVDGWGMIAPGDPSQAADYARRAASVSHDGEAIYGAQVVAAMEAQAFVESDIQKLIDVGLSCIPRDSVIARMIGDIRKWHADEPDWRETRKLIEANYGYDKYGGNCHMVPNHALIIHALLHGEGDLQKSLRIVNTCGWDTDCNSGNVGCLLGIRGGLAAIDAGPDWRGPVADRLQLPTADGGRAISDAVTEAIAITNIGRGLAGEEPLAPKNGARFHFDLPGSVQGFLPDPSPETYGTVTVESVEGHSQLGERALALRYHHVAPGRPARVGRQTFLSQADIAAQGYGMVACPTLYPGQTVRARVLADDASSGPVVCRGYLKVYNGEDKFDLVFGPETMLEPGDSHEFRWKVEETGGQPIAEIGIEISSESRADGVLYLDYLTWEGTPDVVLGKPIAGSVWKKAWVDGVTQFDTQGGEEPYRIMQDEGTGLLIQGTREWTDYRVEATIRPHLAVSFGLAARVQGMRRYYALLLTHDNRVNLMKVANGGETILAKQMMPWNYGDAYELALEVSGNRIAGFVNGKRVFEVEDSDRPLTGGAVALLCEEGRISSGPVRFQPVF